MDLEQASKKHAEWKVKFKNAILHKETVDAATIAKDNCCELGKWLHGEGKQKHGKLTSYSECVKSHAAFHVEAGKVALAINAKKFTEAETMMAISSPFSAASGKVVAAIMHLKAEI